MDGEKQTSIPGSSPPEAADFLSERGLSKRKRDILFITESVFVIVLIIVWISSGILQKSTSLFVLFFYSFPSEFLIAILPHEPVLIYFGKFFSPGTVTAVALSSTLIVEATNYYAIGHLFDLRTFQKFKTSALVNKVVKLFLKAPFLALWTASFTPIIFYPFRFLVVLAKYPAWKFVLAVALGRGPRFYLLALLGKLVKVPNIVLIVFTLFLFLMSGIPFTRNYLKKRRRKKQQSQLST
jgi:membrane protein YqaA with SNARE-associated domain